MVKASRLCWTARIISVSWAGWWTFFAIAGSAVGTAGWTAGLLPGAIAGVVFFGSAGFAWVRAAEGGLLLMLEGLLLAAAYPVGFLHARSADQMLFVLTSLALPPFVSGLLFYGDWCNRLGHRAA